MSSVKSCTFCQKIIALVIVSCKSFGQLDLRQFYGEKLFSHLCQGKYFLFKLSVFLCHQMFWILAD